MFWVSLCRKEMVSAPGQDYWCNPLCTTAIFGYHLCGMLGVVLRMTSLNLDPGGRDGAECSEWWWSGRGRFRMGLPGSKRGPYDEKRHSSA